MKPNEELMHRSEKKSLANILYFLMIFPFFNDFSILKIGKILVQYI